jgi:DNA-directed RNA polymerase specialized sigma24 family protein
MKTRKERSNHDPAPLLVRAIAAGIKTVSPATRVHAAAWLQRRAARAWPWADGESPPVHALVDFYLAEAAGIEAIQRRLYDRAVRNANLPEDVSGAVYIRGWTNLHHYDCRKGALPLWLRGIARKVRQEERRRDGPRGRDCRGHVADVEDPRAADTADIVSDGEFHETFAHFHEDFFRGFDVVEEIDRNLTLLDLWRRALRSCLKRLTPKHRAVIEEVICQDQDREDVARRHGYTSRDGVDKVVSRFVADIRGELS